MGAGLRAPIEKAVRPPIPRALPSSLARVSSESDRSDAPFQSGVGHHHNQLIRSQSVRLDYNRAAFTFRGIERGTELLWCDFLVAHVDGRRRSARDADNLLIQLRRESEAREWHRN